MNLRTIGRINKSISFVIPIYNESESIENTINGIRSIARELTNDYEIIISDDGSTDESVSIIEKLKKTSNDLKIIRQRKNTKFGGALAAGLLAANRDIIVYTDADLPVSLIDIKKALFLIKNADIVTTFSKIPKGENLKRKIISKCYNTIVKILFNIKIKEVNSALKIFKREFFNGINFISKSSFIDAEILLYAIDRRYKIKEYPTIYNKRKVGKSKILRLSIIYQTFVDMIKFLWIRKFKNKIGKLTKIL